MKNKTVDILLSVLVVLIFSIYFTVLYSYDSRLNMDQQLKDTEQYIKEEKWDRALESSKEVEQKWNRIKYIAMANYAQEDIFTLEEHIHILIGGIEAKDSGSSLSGTKHIEYLWKNIKKVVPEP